MIDLTPETAGASSLAIRIAQRVLELDGMAVVRESCQRDPSFSLAQFCAAIARDIDAELNATSKHTPPTSVELSHLERFSGYGFRIDGREWKDCAPFAGHTPLTDSIEHLQAAVVSIAHAHELVITEDQVAVDGRRNAYWFAVADRRLNH